MASERTPTLTRTLSQTNMHIHTLCITETYSIDGMCSEMWNSQRANAYVVMNESAAILANAQVKLWLIASGECHRTFVKHSDSVTACAWYSCRNRNKPSHSRRADSQSCTSRAAGSPQGNSSCLDRSTSALSSSSICLFVGVLCVVWRVYFSERTLAHASVVCPQADMLAQAHAYAACRCIYHWDIEHDEPLMCW